ncbi:uncharacterized protein LOC116159472 [Photinus pyralis]|uniref:uncharacterized protein LOC116159472 n=1 Tax=Photinus pyralis TaxID=7054 RepID=UPI001266ED39|nr:uncharacterized protein LOC116159472 [Photinus pyralis]
MEEVLEALILGDAADDDYEYVIMDNIFVNREEVNQGPPFDFNTLTEEEVLLNFRFSRADLPRLFHVLHIPNVIVTDTRNRVDGFTALLILLKRMAYPCRLADLKAFFNMSSQSLSQIINTTISIILRERGNLLDQLNNLEWLNRERMAVYADAIYNKGGAIHNCWGFIDGTTRGICRPLIDQEEYYSGHKKHHCLKYQSVICPDGIIASFIGAFPGRRHDAAIFR